MFAASPIGRRPLRHDASSPLHPVSASESAPPSEPSQSFGCRARTRQPRGGCSSPSHAAPPIEGYGFAPETIAVPFAICRKFFQGECRDRLSDCAGARRPDRHRDVGSLVSRARTITEIRSVARSHTRTAINVLVGIMRSKDATPAARVSAANAILDRGWGKVALPLQNGEDDALQLVHRIERVIVHPEMGQGRFSEHGSGDASD